jgi:hypothetical protein
LRQKTVQSTKHRAKNHAFLQTFENNRRESKSRRAGRQEKFVKFFTISARLIIRISRDGF